MKTVVIELYAGSGCGKSTTAAGLFYNMKQMGLEVELVREYVKELVWEGVKLTPDKQLEYFKEQSRRESILYNKVNYIITDSPLLLGPIYELYYAGTCNLFKEVDAFLEFHAHPNIQRLRLFLNRTKPFNPKGRNETEEQAREVDVLLKNFLKDSRYDFTEINTDDKYKVTECYSKLLEFTGGLL